MTTDTLIIDGRFNGPPHSGNGGYVCGKVAGLIDGTAEVMLHSPPPLDKPLSLVYDAPNQVRVFDEETLVATGRPAQWTLTPPALPAAAELRHAAAHYPPAPSHPLPTCFVCGDERADGDGMRVFTGQFDGRELVGGRWIPDRSFADERGQLRPEFLWGALDCPGGWSLVVRLWPQLLLLGKLSVQVLRPVYAGEVYGIVGWPIQSEGRKHQTGSAIFTETGDLCAIGKATWISVRESAGSTIGSDSGRF